MAWHLVSLDQELPQFNMLIAPICNRCGRRFANAVDVTLVSVRYKSEPEHTGVIETFHDGCAAEFMQEAEREAKSSPEPHSEIVIGLLPECDLLGFYLGFTRWMTAVSEASRAAFEEKYGLDADEADAEGNEPQGPVALTAPEPSPSEA